ncbi:hypothetical protein SPBR_03032 [Sporothrix brasiliensis 5110]|uniref:Mid2 domain-containing protein n=1 Tax=Sporothrix brasiliensis 5110 TaxID=1398154 RepID=A0A0C2ITZ4_9PEZI|nr:uncharacterized protein SPBR_03032 [Sporothrix brasiliensis 5110]KIH92561.1 hypothetical protein SPBR_03032 [Sporothrix brasiliensis 5110]
MLDTIVSRPARRLAISYVAVFFAASSLPPLTVADSNAPCYDPTGTLAPGYYPCDSTAYITNCCAPGYTCFSNSLCVVTNESKSFPNLTVGAVERSMCTNPQWNNDICGDFCVTGSGNADGEMVACGDNRFCCRGDYNAGRCNCSLSSPNEGGSFVVNAGKPQTIVGETASFTGTVSYLTSQPTPAPTPTSASSLSSSASLPASTSAPSSATSSLASGASTSPTPQPETSKHTLALGLGVGLGVGVPLLAVAGFLYYWFVLRKNSNRRRSSGRRRTLPMDLALDGTAFGEQMAMQGNAYRTGAVGASTSLLDNDGLPGHRLNLSDLSEVPPPPPQVRHDVG